MSLQQRVIQALRTHPYMDRGLPVMVAVEYPNDVKFKGTAMDVQQNTVVLITSRSEHVINFDEALRVAIDGERGQPSTVYERD